jgi:phosphoglycerate-specific signal transduction histidine kinase
LARAKEYAAYLPEVQQEDEHLLSARVLFEEENDRQRVEAELNGLKQDLLAQAQAHEVGDALYTLKRLSTLLDPSDPFLQDAHNEIGQAYLDLAEDAAKEGKREVAVNLVQRAAELVPQSQRVKFLRAKYSQPTAVPAPAAPLEAASNDSTRIAQGEPAARTSTNTPSTEAPSIERSQPQEKLPARQN